MQGDHHHLGLTRNTQDIINVTKDKTCPRSV
jgi:hypothetical protein